MRLARSAARAMRKPQRTKRAPIVKHEDQHHEFAALTGTIHALNTPTQVRWAFLWLFDDRQDSRSEEYEFRRYGEDGNSNPTETTGLLKRRKGYTHY